jgi:hypothetical protein
MGSAGSAGRGIRSMRTFLAVTLLVLVSIGETHTRVFGDRASYSPTALPVAELRGYLDVPSCEYRDVRKAIEQAAASDVATVRIGPGVCEWTEELTISKCVRLHGAGIDQTEIRDNVDKTGTDDRPLLAISVSDPSCAWELAHLTIRGVSPDPGNSNKGHVVLSGKSQHFRVHHVRFVDQKTAAIRTYGDLAGVIDSSEFVANNEQGIIVSHRGFDGHRFGDGSWAAPLTPGGPRAIYIEDNVFRELNPKYTLGAIDAMEGARVVFRYNTLVGRGIGSHGTESGQRFRSVRWFEIYNNRFERDPKQYEQFDTAIRIRGGSGVIFHNGVIGNFGRAVTLSNYRSQRSYAPWGRCDGTSPYDSKTDEGDYRCLDQPGAGTSILFPRTDRPNVPAKNALEPIYLWGNANPGIPLVSVTSRAHIKAGRDYIVDTPRPEYKPYQYPHPRRLEE